jgi:hypothetical protein
MTGFPIGIESLMAGWGMLVIPQRCQITIQTGQAEWSEPLILMLIFHNKKDYQCILLTKSVSPEKLIGVYLM